MPAPPSAAQRARARELRALILEMSAGAKPADTPPPTPREITDDAARRKLAAAQRAKRKR